MCIRFILILLLAPDVASGASFNCARATTLQEKATCASPKLSAADDRMAAAYAKALATTPPELADAVRGDQRAWVRLVPLDCPEQGLDKGRTMAECLDLVYAARIKQLDQTVVQKGSVTFVSRWFTLIAKEENEGPPAPTQRMPGYETLGVSWPIATAAGPEWKAWNKAIEDEVHRIGVFEEDGSAPIAVPALKAPEDDDQQNTASVELVDHNLVTALVDHWWIRGAHPTEASIQLNWLLKEQRELRPDDVFRPGTEWRVFVVRRCGADLRRQLDQTGGNAQDEKAEVASDMVSNPRNWKLGRKGIEIVYQDYAVAPRGAHPSPTRISWDSLKPYLQPGFTPPETSARPN